MHYVYLTNTIVTDQAQVDPFTIFSAPYAEQFIEAPNQVTFGWSLIDGEWVSPPAPTPEEIQAQNKQQATTLLSQTDWTATVDISNPQYSNPYLGNQDEFLAYRSTVRAIAVNPPVIPAIFPDVPKAIWKTN